jgi:hypothetical protein
MPGRLRSLWLRNDELPQQLSLLLVLLSALRWEGRSGDELSRDYELRLANKFLSRPSVLPGEGSVADLVFEVR